MTRNIKVRRNEVLVDGVKVASIIGCREVSKTFGVVCSFAVRFNDGTFKDLPYYGYHKDVVRDLPAILAEKGV